MRAGHIIQEGPAADAIEIVDVETPEPGPGEVRLQVEACGLNRLDVFDRIGHPEEDDDFPKWTGGTSLASSMRSARTFHRRGSATR
jgi:NADPH2:quinone reductase